MALTSIRLCGSNEVLTQPDVELARDNVERGQTKPEIDAGWNGLRETKLMLCDSNDGLWQGNIGLRDTNVGLVSTKLGLRGGNIGLAETNIGVREG